MSHGAALGTFRVTNKDVLAEVAKALSRQTNEPMAEVVKYAHGTRRNSYRAWTTQGRCFDVQEKQYWVKSTWAVTRDPMRDAIRCTCGLNPKCKTPTATRTNPNLCPEHGD